MGRYRIERRARSFASACVVTLATPLLGSSAVAQEAQAVTAPRVERPRGEPPRPAAQTATVQRSPDQKTSAIAMIAAGVVGLGVGTYFGLRAASTWSDAKAGCTAAGCPVDSLLSADDAHSQAAVATIAFTAAGIALATAAVLWITAPSPRRAR